jgi:hypothetical protein
LGPANASTPVISGDQAVGIAGREFLEILRRNRVPEQDVSSPDALVRRHYVSQASGAADVWVVAYRWKAGWNCQHPEVHGPGNCQMASFYFVDDRTGKVVQTFLATLQGPGLPRPAAVPGMLAMGADRHTRAVRARRLVDGQRRKLVSA